MKQIDKHKLFPFPCPSCGKVRKLRASRKNSLCRSCVTSKNSKGRIGELNGNWKGGKTHTSKGYVLVSAPSHPREHSGYVLEHILVAEKKIGRYLGPDECVHHINENKQDNRPENLLITTVSGHAHLHQGYKKMYPCAKCGKPRKNNTPICAECLYGNINWPDRDMVLIKFNNGISLNKQSQILGVSRPRFQSHYKIFPGR